MMGVICHKLDKLKFLKRFENNIFNKISICILIYYVFIFIYSKVEQKTIVITDDLSL